MSKYFFSLVFALFSVLVFSQKETIVKDTAVVKKERFGLRVGIDLHKLSRSIYDKKYKGLELSGDYRISKKYYAAAEIGNENNRVQDDYIDFTTKGTFIKLGADLNLYRNWLDMENMIYLNARFGASTFSQTLNSYKIYNTNQYFGASTTIDSGEKYEGLSAQWLEIGAGVKAKVYNNFYLGFNFRVKRLLNNKVPDGFDNLYIPGFNRTYNGDYGVGFNYTISYFLPLYKTVSTPKINEKATTNKK
jgi:Domain of unknown function (DUF6048)